MSNSSKLVPADPSAVTVFRQVTPNIVTVSAPFKRVGLMKIGGRGTLVRLTNGTLAVFSPTALTPEVQAEVSKMGGEVKYLIAPDAEHHIFLGPWHQAYPAAKVLGPESLPGKRTAQKNEEVKFHTVFTGAEKAKQRIDECFDKDFEYEFVHGHVNEELVFNYKPERTMIQADLIFNLPATEQYSKSNESATSGFWTNLFGKLTHTRGPALGQRRLIWYMASKNDRPGFNASMARIQKWDFDRIIPCHGDVIETGGKEVFNKLMQWHLEAAAKEGSAAGATPSAAPAMAESAV